MLRAPLIADPLAPEKPMTQKSLADLATKMRGIDIAMLSTRTAGGEIASRPISNLSLIHI